MQRAIPVLVLATLFSVSGNSRASLITFTTGHTGADTKINSGASSEWDFQLLPGAPAITEIKGIFDMKIDGKAVRPRRISRSPCSTGSMGLTTRRPSRWARSR